MLEKVNITLKALNVFKNPTKYFSQEQIQEAVRIFYQVWDGNIVRSAQRFIELAKNNPKITRGEGVMFTFSNILILGR